MSMQGAFEAILLDGYLNRMAKGEDLFRAIEVERELLGDQRIDDVASRLKGPLGQRFDALLADIAEALAERRLSGGGPL